MSLARTHHSTSGSVPTGFAEEVVLNDATFRQKHRDFERNYEPPAKRQKREAKGDSSIVFGKGSYKGPFAKWEEVRPDARPSDQTGLASDEEEVEEIEEVSEYEEDALPSHTLTAPAKESTGYNAFNDQEASEFLGSEQYDYQGRTYMTPKTLNVNLTSELPPWQERPNYTPKKLIHTFKDPRNSSGKAHQRSVTCTQFFPDSGHLILSAGADGKLLLFDVYQQECVRSFTSQKGISAIDFDPTGTHFLSSSYDSTIRLWDTETGAATRFRPAATAHCVRFNPSSPTEFLAGLSDNSIVQYDTRAGDKVQQLYEHHTGPINTITYVDENRRFISTSQDRSLRAFEYGIPVPIKLVAEPHLYSITRTALHPSGKFVACQTADNTVSVYHTDKFRQHRSKGFRGHNTAGMAIDLAIAPGGNILASGSSDGSVVFWDWKKCNLYSKIPASNEGPVVALAWHPRETSKMVTGDAEGNLRYWD